MSSQKRSPLPCGGSCCVACITCCGHKKVLEILSNTGRVFYMNSWDFDRLKRVTKIKLLPGFIPLKKETLSIKNADVTKGISIEIKTEDERGACCMHYHDY